MFNDIKNADDDFGIKPKFKGPPHQDSKGHIKVIWKKKSPVFVQFVNWYVGIGSGSFQYPW